MICVNDLWKFIFIFFSLIQMGCSNQIYEPPSDKYPFEVKMIDFFGNNIRIVDSINKYEAQISYFEFTKDSRKLEEIVRHLEKDGWMLKGQGHGVDTYCLGPNNKINIVNPTFGKIQDYKGGELKITNYDVNTVLYRYYKWGDDLCE
ncbi:hypothetical protein Q5X71_10740 [Acinetobacter baumannii]|uniref:hypothetical protein n=2 Tax=Acinetobacter calcoaceticus/baumannii complex TaxID=909768 RepID=UPI00046DD378|nr:MULTISPECIES: hypothetical protein [Acinetobacter calcoaceticus/baumannii complex]EHU1360586.1 hypothetical protein [Acinetobacter baumannii]MBP1479340.1 hypothetical protein [Acinetobacter nosocomialis]MBP1513045.1 hypothetical protein [Acinetobacter nosocomialis]MBR7718328.1 hypothetical protein [Acinetobacter nosocomialis]MDC4370988.1 hypothetical protein [Acinetobacter baumannii]